MISNSMAGMDLFKDSFRGLYIKCSIVGLFEWHSQRFLLSQLVSFSFICPVLFFVAYFLSQLFVSLKKQWLCILKCWNTVWFILFFLRNAILSSCIFEFLCIKVLEEYMERCYSVFTYRECTYERASCGFIILVILVFWNS